MDTSYQMQAKNKTSQMNENQSTDMSSSAGHAKTASKSQARPINQAISKTRSAIKQKNTKSKSKASSLKTSGKLHQKIQEKLAQKLVSKTKQKKQQPSHLAEDLEKSKRESEQYKKDFLYLKAEFENYKKRVLSERSDLLKYASENLAVEILEIVDTFERALSFKMDPQNIQSFIDGMKMVYSSFINALKKHGIEEIPILGKPFDPHSCDALSKEITDTVPPEHISQVIKKPYRLHEKVIRFGQVIVAQKKVSDEVSHNEDTEPNLSQKQTKTSLS